MFNKERIKELEKTVKSLEERVERLEYTRPTNFRKFVKEHRYVLWKDLYWLDREYVIDHVYRFNVEITHSCPNMTEYLVRFRSTFCYDNNVMVGINDMCLGEIVEWCQKIGGKDEGEV